MDIQPTNPTPAAIEPAPDPMPKTWKEFFISVFWRDIDANLGGGRRLRFNVIVFVVSVFTIVSALVILERVGVLDDIKDVIINRHGQGARK
jgi:hypothetical protein